MLRRILLSGSLLALSVALTPAGNAAAEWTQIQHDAQLSGKNPNAAGPSGVGIKWSAQAALPPGGTSAHYQAGVAVGLDGTIYAHNSEAGNTVALDPKTGAVKYTFNIGGCCAPPAVDPVDGTVYFLADALYAYTPPVAPSTDYTLKFRMEGPGGCCAGITVGPQPDRLVYTSGTYAIDPNNLTFIDPENPDPTLAKNVQPKWYTGFGGSQTSVSPDGQTAYTVDNTYLYAVNAADGSLKWQYPCDNSTGGSNAVVDDESGVIYAGCGSSIIAIDPALVDPGAQDPFANAVTTVWTIDGKQVGALAYDADNEAGPTLIATVLGFTMVDGNKVFAADEELYAVYAAGNPDNSWRWTQQLSGTAGEIDISQPAIDKKGAVYVTTSNYADGVDYASHLYGFNTYGDLMFEYGTPLDNSSDTRRVALADNGTVYALLNGAVKAFGPVIDLSVALDCSPNPVAINGTLTCTVIVANAGPDTAPASTLKLILPASLSNASVTYNPNPDSVCTLNGSTITCTNIGPLDADMTTILNLTGTAPGTLTTLSVSAQVTSPLADTNPTNNTVSASIRVLYPGVELLETSVSNPPASVSRGSSISITDTIKNDGRVTAGTSYVQYWLATNNGTTKYKKLTTTASGSTPASRTISTLAGGSSNTGSVTAYIPTSTTPGVYYLLACADETHLITEYMENNNCKASTLPTTVN